jgi:hypothetical protein
MVHGFKCSAFICVLMAGNVSMQFLNVYLHILVPCTVYANSSLAAEILSFSSMDVGICIKRKIIKAKKLFNFSFLAYVPYFEKIR